MPLLALDFLRHKLLNIIVLRLCYCVKIVLRILLCAAERLALEVQVNDSEELV